jgi:hypothetical protein
MHDISATSITRRDRNFKHHYNNLINKILEKMALILGDVFLENQCAYFFPIVDDFFAFADQ